MIDFEADIRKLLDMPAAPRKGLPGGPMRVAATKPKRWRVKMVRCRLRRVKLVTAPVHGKHRPRRRVNRTEKGLVDGKWVPFDWNGDKKRWERRR